MTLTWSKGGKSVQKWHLFLHIFGVESEEKRFRVSVIYDQSIPSMWFYSIEDHTLHLSWSILLIRESFQWCHSFLTSLVKFSHLFSGEVFSSLFTSNSDLRTSYVDKGLRMYTQNHRPLKGYKHKTQGTCQKTFLKLFLSVFKRSMIISLVG